jgi:hypothetical protein
MRSRDLFSVSQHDQSERTQPRPIERPPIYNKSLHPAQNLPHQNPLLRVSNALKRSLRVLDNLLHSADVLAALLLSSLEGRLVLDAGVVHENARGLGGADAEEEEVDRSQEQVAGLDDEAPASPDQAGGGQSGVLREREVLCGTGEIGGAGEDETPLREREGVSEKVVLLRFCAVILAPVRSLFDSSNRFARSGESPLISHACIPS